MPLEEYIGQIRTLALGDFRPEKFPEVRIAGRFMGQRGPFAKLQDAHGKIQLYLKKGTLGDTQEAIDRNDQLLKLLHIGDFIAVTGELFATQTGEVTVKVKDLRFLSKALRNLPIVKKR